MAFDWKSGRLYFTNVGHSGPNLDGTVYSWHTVVFVEVNTKKRKTILYEVENPLALALDLNQRFVLLIMCLLITFAYSLEPDRVVGPDLNPSRFTL